MGRASTRENKTQYQLIREELGLSREKAGDLLETITPERIEKIENEKSYPHPDEVLLMSQKYRKPALCNYYCSNECPIGREYVPEIQLKELTAIVVEMLAALNAVNRTRERLIDIAADSVVSRDEAADFFRIQEELERVSVSVETLQLWSEKMLANGIIDDQAYRFIRGK